MRSIKISDEVYEEIAKRGKFGETEDDVLRRVFGITEVTSVAAIRSSPSQTPRGGRRVIHAQRRMTAKVQHQDGGDILTVAFEDGPSKEWKLPQKSDTHAIRIVTEEALGLAEREGGTQGQLNYIRKALSQAGYYLRGPQY